MSQEINKLEPTTLWKNFVAINQIPRASKKEEQIVAFISKFGKALNLETEQDSTGNIIIRKPATPGLENRKTVILQSHLDMVHQKNNDTQFDFGNEGIRMFIENDWVRAEGTTLGADNGIGVAAIMAILAAEDIAHPAIEALFTVDEETGMTGANELSATVLQGDILLNLDTEDDDEICIGSAGGLDITATKVYKQIEIPENYGSFKITVNGLTGGHSGMDINKGLGNANKIMNRVLHHLAIHSTIHISEITGGSLRNAIPRESVAILASNADYASLSQHLQDIATVIQAELKTKEPLLNIGISPHPTAVVLAMNSDDQNALLSALYTAHNGVYAMSADFQQLVLTSNNIAKTAVKNGQITIQCLARSSSDSSKTDLANSLRAAFELMDATVEFSGFYPGWLPNPDSEILAILTKIYEKQNGRPANTMAVHAGLECGVLGEKYPNLDKISFGPTILGAHSPDERVSISSVQKFWKFLVEILKNTPSTN